MEFGFTQDQDAMRDLAKKMFEDLSSKQALEKVEKADEYILKDLWSELGKAQLLGIAIAEDAGGVGLNFLDLCILLEQVGRTAAAVPVFPSLVLGALPIDKFGSAAMRKRILPGVAAGDLILTAGIFEYGSDDPARPTTKAVRDGNMWVLDGVKTAVQAAHIAKWMIIPAKTGDGQVGLFLVDPKGKGVTIAKQVGTNREILGEVTLKGVRVEDENVVGSVAQGAEIMKWWIDRATAAVSIMMLGASERALRMTAEYTSQRHQFGMPIATFQAVGQRAADAYVDVEAIRLAAWQAAWRLSDGRNADMEVSLAKYWAADGGHRVVAAAHHLHGGMGFDTDYPLFRFFLFVKFYETYLGGASRHLVKLGQQIAKSKEALTV